MIDIQERGRAIYEIAARNALHSIPASREEGLVEEEVEEHAEHGGGTTSPLLPPHLFGRKLAEEEGPSVFRRRHGDEALPLVMDRARHEGGAVRQYRLSIDLFFDLLFFDRHPTTLPYGSQSAVSQISPSAPPLIGFLVSITLLATLSLGFREPGNGGNWNFPRWPITAQVALPRPQQQRPHEGNATSTMDAAKRHKLIQAITLNVKDHYFDPSVAKTMIEALRANDASGSYNTITDIRDFASLLTRQLRDLSQNLNIEVVYSDRPLPDGPPPRQSAEPSNQYRTAMLRQDCTFEKVQMLPGRIGYLKFNFFSQTAVCKHTAQSAMAAMNGAESVVLDLRDNGGGFQDMVMLMASWFFDHPEYMYNPRENTTEQSWTRSPVHESRLTDKPLYLLTSARTISAAEDFSWNLKMLKRATLVGETTRGSAHSGVFRRIDNHLGVAIPEVKPINPFAKSDWEGIGVEADVKVDAAEALTTAIALARRKPRQPLEDGSERSPVPGN